MRTIGPEGSRPKKPCDTPPSTRPVLEARNIPSEQFSSEFPITNGCNPELRGSPAVCHEDFIVPAGIPSTSEPKGLSRSTLWRRAEKEQEREKEVQRRL